METNKYFHRPGVDDKKEQQQNNINQSYIPQPNQISNSNVKPQASTTSQTNMVPSLKHGTEISQTHQMNNNGPIKHPKRKGIFLGIAVICIALVGLSVVAISLSKRKNQFKKHDSMGKSASDQKTEIDNTIDNSYDETEETSQTPEDKSNEKALVEDKMDTEVDVSNAESYFNNYSEVISVEKADVATGVHTEKSSIQELEGRGFDEYEILTHYSMNGDYYDEDEVISDSSSDKHPMYETYYYNSSGELWKIMLIDDEIVANPISYNLQFKQSTSVVISESEHVMSYDCYSNSFYKTIPEKSELLVITEETIDTKILDNYTFEKIDKIFEDENKNSNEQTTE